MMRNLILAAVLLGLAGCGKFHPESGTGAAAVPTTQGGGAGAQEGSPLDARNLGSGPTTTLDNRK